MARSFNAKAYDSEELPSLPPGEYDVFIVDDPEASSGVKRGNGKKGEYLSLTLMITSPEKYKGMRIWTNLSLAENALFKLAQLYQAVEPAEDNQREFDLDSDEEVHQELFYKVFRVKCNYEKYNGKNYLRPERFIAITDDAEYSAAFEVATQLVNQGKAGGGPRNIEEANDTGNNEDSFDADEDDDIPF